MGDDVRDDASDIVAEYEADDILMLATLIGIGPGNASTFCILSHLPLIQSFSLSPLSLSLLSSSSSA
jgi:hypothetical protein